MTVCYALLDTLLDRLESGVAMTQFRLGNASSGTAIHAQGRFTLALDSKNVFIPAENFVQLHDKDASSHSPFNRTTELRGFGIGTMFGPIIIGNPGGDMEPVTRSS
jgi:hypothetical protein